MTDDPPILLYVVDTHVLIWYFIVILSLSKDLSLRLEQEILRCAQDDR